MSIQQMDSSLTSLRQATTSTRYPQRLITLLFLSILVSLGLYTAVYFTASSDCSTSEVHKLLSSGTWLDKWWTGFSTQHNLTDDELLWYSSIAARRLRPVTTVVPKVAFMFMTRGPLPLLPLWDMYFRDHSELYSIYVHTAPDFVLDVPRSSAFYGRQIPSKDTQWGEITMCDAERRLLANALMDHRNQRFILLSETCAPLFNFSTLYNYVVNSKHSFLSVFDDQGPFGRGRYTSNFEPEVTLEQWRKGSQWFEVDREVAILLVSDSKYYEKFRQYCRPPCYVDEHYFPTMLSIEAGNLLANRSLTFVDWSRGGAHPATFGKEDVTPEFIKKLKHDSNCPYNGELGHMCFMFARKFSPNALEPLVKLLKDELLETA